MRCEQRVERLLSLLRQVALMFHVQLNLLVLVC